MRQPERNMKLINKIARDARAILRRQAIRSKRFADFQAADAVAAAALANGLTQPLGAWVQCGRSVRQMAWDYVSRYCQAYGSVDGMIDVGQHLGAKHPITVQL